MVFFELTTCWPSVFNDVRGSLHRQKSSVEGNVPFRTRRQRSHCPAELCRLHSRTCLEKALSSMVWCQSWPWLGQGLGLEISQGPFLPEWLQCSGWKCEAFLVLKAVENSVFLSFSPQPTCGSISLFLLAVQIPCLSVFFSSPVCCLPSLPANTCLQLLPHLTSHLSFFTSLASISPALGSRTFARLPSFPPSPTPPWFFYPFTPRGLAFGHVPALLPPLFSLGQEESGSSLVLER